MGEEGSTVWCVCVCVCVCACTLSHVRLFEIQRAVVCQAPLSIEFFRQDYWRKLLFPTPEDLPDPGMEPTYHASPALAGGFFTTASAG